MPRLALLIITLVALNGCSEPNSAFCQNPNNAEEPSCRDAGNGGPCKDNADCTDTANFPVCDTMASPPTCVQCTASDHALCTGTTPICENNSCIACVIDDDCGTGGLCLPSGACALLSDVAYVDGTDGVDGAPCTMDMPCAKIDEAAGLKNIVKVSGIVQDRCLLDGNTTTILGQPGAKLMPSGDGPALEIKGASRVEVYDLEINHATGGPGKNAFGVLVADTAEVLMTRVKLIDNTADGASVTGGHFTCTLCTITQNDVRGVNVAAGLLTISQSTLSNNTGGGINIGTNGSFEIVGNVIFNNGQNDKVTGGISISVDGSTVNRLDFNSISHNTATNGVGPGIQCISGQPLIARSNIIWNNGSDQPQVSGGCTYAYSDIGPLPVQTGTNMTIPPLFKDEAAGDLHLMSTSPVRRVADPATDLSGLAARDIDGDPRVPPRADLGADQTP